MATESLLVRDLAMVMMAAAATSLVFRRLGQPTVLGYLVAGVLVGPHVVPGGLIRDPQSISVLAELGTLFLLFSLGLDFHLGKLRRVGGVAFVAGFLQMVLMVGLGAFTARLFGWNLLDALFLGAVLAISGGAVIVKVLEELGRGATQTAQVVTGIVVVERIGGVMLLALLTSFATTGAFEPAPLLALGLRLSLFILIALVLGLLIVPRIVDIVARMRAEESLVIALLGIAFGLSLLSSRLGLTIALGAFMAGALIAEASAGPLARQRVAPLRDAFVAVFFVAMGLLLDPFDLIRYAGPILAISAVVIVGKAMAVGVSTMAAGYPARQSFHAGLSMGMLGGFALVIANLGRELGVTRPELFSIILAVTAITTFATPMLMRRSNLIVDATARLLPMRIRHYSRMYIAWVGRHHPTESGAYRALRVPLLVRLGTYATLLTSLVVGGAYLARRVAGPDAQVAGREMLEVAAVLALMLLLAIPLSIGVWRAASKLIDHFVALLVPPALAERPFGRAAGLLLRGSLDAFALAVVAIVLLSAAAIFLPPLPLLLGAAVAVAIFARFTRRALGRVDKEMEDALDTLLADQAAPGTREDMLRVLEDRADWDMHVEGVLVAPGSSLAYRRIQDAKLPTRTGATILAVERDGEHLLNPPPELVLQPGDTLSIVGTLDQVEAAKSVLATEAPPAPLRGERGLSVEEIELLGSSPLAGVPLAESRLRERTGATIVGLRRGGRTHTNPGPEMLLQPGDALLVVGAPEQVEEARRFIAPPRAG